MPLVGELYGICQQVEYYLAQSQAIADDKLGQRRINVQDQFDLFRFRCRRNQFHAACQNIADVDRTGVNFHQSSVYL